MENQPSISSDLIRGHIDTIILFSLLENDKFAQQISDYVEVKSENSYKINQATLYSSLKRLESLKYISSFWRDFDDGRRKFFSITESGKLYVESNLSSWAYSKTIIDKLMGISPVYSATVFESDIGKNAEVSPANYESETEPVTTTEEINKLNGAKEDVVKSEFNFRSVLNGLIKTAPEKSEEDYLSRETAEIPKTAVQNDKKEIVSEKISADVLKFNDTIAETDYNVNKINAGGKIDYGDLAIKAAKEGYVIRVSSKDSAKKSGDFLINKLNFVSILLLCLAVAAEIGILSVIFSGAITSTAAIIFIAVNFVALVVFAAVYLKNKKHTIDCKIRGDGILNAAIVAFNAILIILAIGFLADLDFSDNTTLISAFIVPIALCVNAVIFFLIRFIIAERKTFHVKKN